MSAIGGVTLGALLVADAIQEQEAARALQAQVCGRAAVAVLCGAGCAHIVDDDCMGVRTLLQAELVVQEMGAHAGRAADGRGAQGALGGTVSADVAGCVHLVRTAAETLVVEQVATQAGCAVGGGVRAQAARGGASHTGQGGAILEEPLSAVSYAGIAQEVAARLAGLALRCCVGAGVAGGLALDTDSGYAHKAIGALGLALIQMEEECVEAAGASSSRLAVFTRGHTASAGVVYGIGIGGIRAVL